MLNKYCSQVDWYLQPLTEYLVMLVPSSKTINQITVDQLNTI